MRNAGLEEAQAGTKIARRNINNLRYADDTFMTENEELKSLLMNMKEESEKAGLRLNQKNKYHSIQSHHFLANRWENNGNSDRLYIWGLQNHCSHELKRCLLAPWKKSYDQPRQHIKKQRHYFANKGLSSQSYGFSSSHV